MSSQKNWYRMCLFIFLLFSVSCNGVDSEPTPTERPEATETPVAPTPEPTAIPDPTVTPDPTRDVVYAHVADIPTGLDVYVPDGAGPWPVVIIVHGVHQVKAETSNLADAISAEGALVYNIYNPYFSNKPFIDNIERIGCAVRYARATAEEFGGDPNHITLVGISGSAATGVVVALAGDDFAGNCVVSEGSTLVNAFVGYEGKYDFSTKLYGQIFDHRTWQPEETELRQAINPYTHIGRQPELVLRLIHGDDTDTNWYDVQLKVSRNFYEALEEAGYDVELHILEESAITDIDIISSDAFAMVVDQVMSLAGGSGP